jgi:hypothetical protein
MKISKLEKIMGISAIFLMILIIFLFKYFQNNYVELRKNIPPDDISEIELILKENNIPFKIDNNTLYVKKSMENNAYSLLLIGVPEPEFSNVEIFGDKDDYYEREINKCEVDKNKDNTLNLKDIINCKYELLKNQMVKRKIEIITNSLENDLNKIINNIPGNEEDHVFIKPNIKYIYNIKIETLGIGVLRFPKCDEIKEKKIENVLKGIFPNLGKDDIFIDKASKDNLEMYFYECIR